MVLAPNFWSLIDFLHAFLTVVDFSTFRSVFPHTHKYMHERRSIHIKFVNIIKNVMLIKLGAKFCENEFLKKDKIPNLSAYEQKQEVICLVQISRQSVSF